MDDVDFHLISLRPVGGHEGLRRAARRRGGKVMAMSPRRIALPSNGQTRRQLLDALTCTCVVFTSPDAVRAASKLRALKAKRGQQFFGVGEGTRRALQRVGVASAKAPDRMDSEGLLAMPEMLALKRGDALGLVTAPGGRGEIARQLQMRGVRIVRADVYAREPVTITNAAWQRLRQVLDDATSPTFLALSSGEAFDAFIAQTPSALSKRLRNVTLVAASDRLAALARTHGFRDIRRATSARPHDLLAAINIA